MFLLFLSLWRYLECLSTKSVILNALAQWIDLHLLQKCHHSNGPFDYVLFIPDFWRYAAHWEVFVILVSKISVFFHKFAVQIMSCHGFRFWQSLIWSSQWYRILGEFYSLEHNFLKPFTWNNKIIVQTSSDGTRSWSSSTPIVNRDSFSLVLSVTRKADHSLPKRISLDIFIQNICYLSCLCVVLFLLRLMLLLDRCFIYNFLNACLFCYTTVVGSGKVGPVNQVTTSVKWM